jgi:CRP/FNR family cyclic AMP-dependent transcriptional regulator
MRKPASNEFDPQAFLAKVGAGKKVLNIKKNQHVFEQGAVADTVFYIQKGRIKLTVLSEQGKEAVVGILEPGQFFGEGCLNGHPLRIATTTAMEECLITAITKESMIGTLRSEPKFSELFMANCSVRWSLPAANASTPISSRSTSSWAPWSAMRVACSSTPIFQKAPFFRC